MLVPYYRHSIVYEASNRDFCRIFVSIVSLILLITTLVDIFKENKIHKT